MADALGGQWVAISAAGIFTMEPALSDAGTSAS
jgi:hypothetical protein